MLLFNSSLNAAENLLGRRLSDKQKAEVVLSHNAGNELYNLNDFARVSTKARILEDFSSYERRVLMKNWVVGTSPEFKLHSAGFSNEEVKIFLSEARGYNEKTRIVEEILGKAGGSSSVNYQLTSVVKKDNVLLKEANRLGADDSKDINNMLDALIRGGNPGIGLRNLGNGGISYARARDGARVFFKIDEKNKKIIIVGYSNKNNEDKVIKRIQTLYP